MLKGGGRRIAALLRLNGRTEALGPSRRAGRLSPSSGDGVPAMDLLDAVRTLPDEDWSLFAGHDLALRNSATVVLEPVNRASPELVELASLAVKLELGAQA